VATSALHSKQYFPERPGSPNNSPQWPQTLHCPLKSHSVPFGPVNTAVSPLAPCLTSRLSLHGALDLLGPRVRLAARMGSHDHGELRNALNGGKRELMCLNSQEDDRKGTVNKS